MYTVGEIIRKSAHLFPDNVAVVFEGTRLTYRELNRRVNRLARALKALGLDKQDRLTVLSENTHKYLEIYFAAGKLGLGVTPLNFRLSDQELISITQDAEATVFFASEGYEGRALSWKPHLPRIRHWISMEQSFSDYLYYEDLLQGEASEEPEGRAEEDELAILMYTGGTTGRPKGVMMSHRSLVHSFLMAAIGFSFSRYDATCFVLPLFHVSFWPAFAVLLAGGKVVINRRPDLTAILRLIQEEQCTHINAVPTLYGWLLQHPQLADFDLSSLRLITYAGSPFPPELLKQCIKTFGPKFEQAYAMTECIGGTVLFKEDHVLEGPKARLLASAGKASIGVEVRVADEEDWPVPSGQIGEILIRSRSTMMGYWKNPDLTREALCGGWYHTGDMGYMDDEGYLFLVDRKADMIVTGGENVYPKETEDVLYQHPAVAMAAVVSAPDEKWGERVQAVVVLKPDHPATEEELIAFCKERLAGYKCPKAVSFWSELPTTAVGKILRKEVKKKFWEGRERSIG